VASRWMRALRQTVAVLALVAVGLVAFAVRPPQAAAINGNVTGSVYIDTNDNGVRDPGEPGLAAVGLGAGYAILSGFTGVATFTAADGSYSFNILGLTGTQVVVTVTAPAGYELAHPATANDQASQTIALGGTASFGLVPIPPTVTIGDHVWLDTNGNGVQDGGEIGDAGVSVQLLDSTATTVLATATTDSGGNYHFSSATGASTASTIDNLALLTAGATYVVRLPTTNQQLSIPVPGAGGTITTADFGVIPTAAINVQISSSGTGQPGIAGVTLTLTNSANAVVATLATDATGLASFAAVPAGQYTVTVAASNFAAGAVLAGRAVSTGAISTPVTLTPSGGDGRGRVRPGRAGAGRRAGWAGRSDHAAADPAPVRAERPEAGAEAGCDPAAGRRSAPGRGPAAGGHRADHRAADRSRYREWAPARHREHRRYRRAVRRQRRPAHRPGR